MPLPLAGIVRVSHMGDRKAGADNVHADREQVETVLRYAKPLGADVVFMPPELSVSGGKPISERPSLQAAIEGVEQGRFQGIVVSYLSRLTRSRSGLEIWDRVEAAGGHVHCAAESLDTSTPNGRFVRDIHLANAVREREEHQERFELRARVATEAGVWQRRVIPTGYDKDPVTRRLVPNADAGMVREAFRARATGAPLIEIARALGLTPSGARHLLRNRVYLGELNVRSYVNETAHPPIVTVDEYDAAQAARRVRGSLHHPEPALLAGLVRCSGCGHVMSRGSGGGNRRVYGCSIHKSAGRCPEPATITMGRLDALLSHVGVLELARLSATAAHDTGEADRLREQRAAARRDLNVFLEVTASAGLDADTLSAGIRQRQEAVREADARVRVLDREQNIPDVGDPQVFWDGMSVGEQGEFLRGFVETVVVRKVGKGGTVVPVTDRVRVIRAGAGLFTVKAGSEVALPLVRIWPNLDDPRVLRVPAGEDAS
jgi:DNA invertase Pin-like site-specific DNA recombinase